MSPRVIYNSKPFLVMEFIVFYVFLPFIAANFLNGWYKIIPLVLIALLFLFLLLNDPSFDKTVLTSFKKNYLGKSIVRMLLITVLLLWFTWWIFPNLFFRYPVENFNSYLLTFFLYPIASVFPQEIIYRVYYFHRYEALVPQKYLLMFTNAFIFGLTHFIYGNFVAPIATFVAGWIFIYNYYRTRSLLNVSLEHYFYGLIMFTIGLGYFFQ
ncbi:MAG: CPBP family intramembrane glutamic endopeptidase [Salinimicrobium sp.]